MKKMIRLLHRRFAVKDPQFGWALDRSRMKPIIWNGQVGDKNCLIDYDTKSEWDTEGACPDINADLDKEQNDGETTDDCASPNPRQGSSNSGVERRQNGGSCPLVPGTGNGGSGGGGGGGQTVTFTSGASPKPTCASGTGCGGQLCTGYWCNPKPTGVPPDYHDPKDPNAGNPVSTTQIDGPTTTTSRPPPAPTTTTRPPDPPAPVFKAFVHIMLSEFYTGGGLDPWSRTWVIFGNAADKYISACDDRPLLSTKANGVVASNPDLPPSLGQFTVEGFQCQWEGGGDDKLGELKCSGSSTSTTCQDIRSEESDYCLFGGVIAPVVYCRIFS